MVPERFLSRMKEMLGDGYEAFESALGEKNVRAVRVNTTKLSVEEFLAKTSLTLSPIGYAEDGFIPDNADGIGKSAEHHAGMFYVQDPGAMATVKALDIKKGWRVLDACAAPGGKASQLAAAIGEEGFLLANEYVPKRAKIIVSNFERLGIKNAVVTSLDTSTLGEMYPCYFDLVLCDAPCSGEGMFRKEEIAISEWSEENVLMCANRSAEILENAVKTLKSGGYIVYATCTFSLEENEMTIDAFLERHPEFELVPVNERVQKYTADGVKFEGCRCENIHFTRRFYPHIARGEGQFMAVLHHKGEKFETAFYNPQKPKTDKLVTEFLKDTLTEYNPDFVAVYNGNPIYYNNRLPIADRTAFCCGVTIGEIRKNYILPHHQFFMAMGDKFKRKIDLSVDSAELSKYLHGEEFDTNCQNGWAVVTVNGCAVGGVKVSNGHAKNHYPKGLRLV